MKVLVTGGTGFVGRRVIDLLLEGGHAVTRCIRQPAAPLNGVHDWMVGDIGASTPWRAADLAVDVVIHLAARAHIIRESEAEPDRAFQEVNAKGTEVLARAAADASVSRFILVSSAGVYGYADANARPFDEGSPVAPNTPYARSKWMGEQALEKVAAETGLAAVTIRPPLVYGPGNGGNMLRLLELIGRNLPLPLASVRNHRSLIYVDNLAAAIIACATHGGQVSRLYVVRDGQDVSTPELITLICQRFDPPRRRPWPFPESLLHTISSILGASKATEAMLSSLCVRDDRIRGELGWSPPVSLETGLSHTVRWYQAFGKCAGIAPFSAPR